jgi:predicted permease
LRAENELRASGESRIVHRGDKNYAVVEKPMPVWMKFLIFQGALFGPFFAGYAGKKRFSGLHGSTRSIIRFNLIFIEPLIVFWSVWGLTLERQLAVLPAAGLVLVLLGLAAGTGAAAALGLAGSGRPTFIISASLANHGFTLGGFICYLLLGETGLGYSFIFISYFMPFVFLFVFPYARAASGVPLTWKSVFSDYVLSLQNMPLLALIAALGMNALGIGRAAVYFPVDLLLLISIALYYFSLGISFNPSDIRALKRETVVLACIKFLVVPGLLYAALSFFPLTEMLRSVIIIQSFMPAAIYSVVSAVLFNLDTKMASGLFISNTLVFLLLVLPLVLLWRMWSPGF